MEYKIDKQSGCWEWLGPKNRVGGYGIFYRKSKKYYAHRYYYEAVFGEIPKGFNACHKCDNPGCVNPNHIFIGTHRDNMLDASKKGRIGKRRSPPLCKMGHNDIRRDSRGWAYCRTCKTNKQRAKRKLANEADLKTIEYRTKLYKKYNLSGQD